MRKITDTTIFLATKWGSSRETTWRGGETDTPAHARWDGQRTPGPSAEERHSRWDGQPRVLTPGPGAEAGTDTPAHAQRDRQPHTHPRTWRGGETPGAEAETDTPAHARWGGQPHAHPCSLIFSAGTQGFCICHVSVHECE